MPNITHNRAFPYDNREIDILVGPLDEDGPRDEDTTYGFDEKKDGSDVLFFNLEGTDGNDQFFGGVNDDTIKGGKGLDALYGGDGEDWIYGGADRDWLFGEDGPDHLFGQEGSDELHGGPDDDELYGNELNDWLEGGDGNDLLVGGEDADWLTGGSGSDIFRIFCENGFEIDSIVFHPDLIMDFSATDWDFIDLEGAGLYPDSGSYVEATIGYGAGYEAAKMHAESLFSGGTKYAFVTDHVDGYLFVDWVQEADGLVVDAEVGIILVGLTSESDFAFVNMLL